MYQDAWTNLNNSSYFPSFGSLWAVQFTSDVSINNRWTLLTVSIILWVFQHFDWLDSVTNIAARFCTLSGSSWLHLGVPNLTVLLQDWTHQSFISCSINVLINSRTCWSIISFEGEIGMEANDLVNCIPERGHYLIIKYSILFYLLSDARLLCQQS